MSRDRAHVTRDHASGARGSHIQVARAVGRLVVTLGVVTVLIGCADSGSGTVARAVDPRLAQIGGDSTSLAWSPCGEIQCASLAVPVNHAAPTGGTMSLPVYGRASATGRHDRVLVLLADRERNDSARVAVQKARLRLGAGSDDFTVVALAVRGSTDASLPSGADRFGGTIDVVDDLEILIRSIGVEKVRVVGWGSGATIAATWVMLHPRSVAAAVLDTPSDPSSSYLRQGVERIESFASGVESMMRWCAAHLSCSLNQETRKQWVILMKRVAAGDAPAALTRDLINRAGYAALMHGDFSGFFHAVRHGFEGTLEPIRTLANSVPLVSDGAWRCADYRAVTSRALAREWSLHTWRWLVPGDHGQLFDSCEGVGASSRPLGAVTPVVGAKGARVLVTIARFDPTVSPTAARTMAKRMKWTYRSVPVTSHLVIGTDRAMTARAMSFLSE